MTLAGGVAVKRFRSLAPGDERLLPGGPSHHRNPPGTLDRQAARLLALLS